MADRKRTTPRRPPPLPPPVEAQQPNSLTSAASILGTKLRKLPDIVEWEPEVWAYYRTVPECQFAVNWKAGAMSRVRLVAAVPGEGGDEPHAIDLDDPDDAAVPGAAEAISFVESLAGGIRGQAALLKEFSLYLDVPGSGYLVGEPPTIPVDTTNGVPTSIVPTPTSADPRAIAWHLLSNGEIRQSKKAGAVVTEIRDGETGDWRTLPENALVVRVWSPDPEKHWMATSPTRGAIPVLRELDILNKHIETTGMSRLAGAGMLLMPSEAETPTDPKYAKNEDGTPRPPALAFLAMITDAMITAIKDRDSASVHAPIVAMVPGDMIAHARHLTFSTPFDERVSELRNEARARYATSTDLPTEIVSGLSDSNHWTAWQIAESAIRLHIEPRMETICWALTEGYLQPLMRALHVDNPDLMVWFDTSELVTRPDRTTATAALYDKMVAGPRAALREAGLSEDDMPTDDELKRMILLSAASTRGDLIGMILHDLGIPTTLPNAPLLGSQAEMGGAAPGDAPDSGPVGGTDGGTGPPARPDAPPDPTAETPAQEEGIAAAAAAAGYGDDALLLVADVLVWRALERAGNRLRTLSRRTANAPSESIAPHRLHETVNVCSVTTPASLLDGSWDRVPEVARRLSIEPGVLVKALDDYTTGLLVDRREHTIEALGEALGG